MTKEKNFAHKFPPGEAVYGVLQNLGKQYDLELASLVHPWRIKDEFKTRGELDDALNKYINQQVQVKKRQAILKIAQEEFERLDPATNEPYIRDTFEVIHDLDTGFRGGMTEARNVGKTAISEGDNSEQVAEDMGNAGMHAVMEKHAVELVFSICTQLDNSANDS